MRAAGGRQYIFGFQCHKMGNILSGVMECFTHRVILFLLMQPSKINRSNISSKLRSPITCSWYNFLSGRFVRLFLLALAVCVVWLTIEGRWGSNFQFPVRYNGDSHYILGMIKLVKDGDLGLFTHIKTKSLGAPFIGQLNDFPQTERVIVWVSGQISRVIGLMPAANAILVLSAVIASLSFYLAARLWRVPRLEAWTFAIIYAFLPQSHRSLDHLGIAFTGLLPLQFYCCWYLSTAQRLSWHSFRFKLTFVIGLLSGLLNIYWVFLFVHIYLLAILCRLVSRRRNLIISLIPLIASCLIAGVFLASFIVYRESYGENSAALVRSYFDAERWALKPIDLLIPNWGYSGSEEGFLSRYYGGGRLEVGESWWGAYIGFCAIFGLLFLFLKSIQRQLNKRPPSIPCVAALWIIFYTSVGGVHAILCLILDFYDIRGTNRYSAAIATIGLLYLAFVIPKLIRSWPFKVKVCLLVLLVLLALWDQSFKIYTFPFGPNRVIKERVLADRDLVSTLEECLAPGSMLYELPVLAFPEPFSGRGAYKFASSFYGSMRPFLYSSKLRYTYGSNKGRQGADWQLDVEELPAGEMAAVLESYGVSGILLNRNGYEDRGEQLLAEFSEAGWLVGFEQGVDNEWVFIPLKPAENPILPTLTPYALSVTQ